MPTSLLSRRAAAGWAAVLVAALLALVAGYQALGPDTESAAPPPAASPTGPEEEAPGFLYGRVVTYAGTAYEGRLRWGGGEEAFWDNYFNGVKDENPWAAQTPLEGQTEARPPIKVFGFTIPRGEGPVDLGRPFMARFGDIARIEARGDGVRGAIQDGIEFDPDVRVTLKSGTVFDLDRLSSSDFDDGVRIWDRTGRVVDLGPNEIRLIELLPTARLRGVPDRLYGTVRTRQGDFTGSLQWDREEATGRDELVGRTDDGEVGLRFETIRSIERRSQGGSLVTQADGRETVLTGTRKVGPGNRGVYVDDPRYGRVLVSWDAFERVDFSAGGSGPAYGDFVPGHPLRGTVTTRSGRRHTGRLVFDLDESETTETLDAPLEGVDYTIPFGRVTSVALPAGGGRPVVTLEGGEALELERAGDLGEGNAGMLILSENGASDYVPWGDVTRVEFDSPAKTAASDDDR